MPLTSPRRINSRQILCACLYAFAALLPGSAAAQTAPPQASLNNGILQVTLYLPDVHTGFYRGTRFDWSGILASLTFAGHSYYGPWFTGTDPSVRDYVFSADGITAGPASAITGPAEEFQTPDGSAVGYAEAKPGGTFLKIGVGLLRRPDDQKYSFARIYPIVDGGKWKVRSQKTSITFTQTLLDQASGYGYLYTKTVRLLPGQPRMRIEHTLKNIGRQPIVTDVYNHNFTIIDHDPPGPNLSVTLPFAIQLQRPIKEDLGEVQGNRILYRRPLTGRDVFTVHIAGFGASAADNDIRIEDRHAGAGVRITGDHPLHSEELWSIRSVLAMEPFIHLDVAPRATARWSESYLYYTLP